MIEEASWINSFFGGERDFYGRVYKTMGVFDRKDTEKEVDDIIDLLKPEQGSHILDWCGGWGRHAIPHAKRAIRNTLLDFSAEYLERAQAYAKQEGVEITTVCSDFRYTPFHIQADYAVNLFTAGLGYLGEENDIIALKSLLSALKPQARILIDTMSLFWIVRNFKDNNWDESTNKKKRYFQRRSMDFWTNTEIAVNTYQDTETKTEDTVNVELKLYCPADLSHVLKMAGFAPQELFGGLDGSKFCLNSKRVVMTAQKP
ncbi:MAG: class I SAM-dependent methyltransferase [bacterium]|nr:class I SAM-dependent methyltransferase [bacterium]MDO8496379.1 class I SAM-dependent methyltransferase [bacterium]